MAPRSSLHLILCLAAACSAAPPPRPPGRAARAEVAAPRPLRVDPANYPAVAARSGGAPILGAAEGGGSLWLALSPEPRPREALLLGPTGAIRLKVASALVPPPARRPTRGGSAARAVADAAASSSLGLDLGSVTTTIDGEPPLEGSGALAAATLASLRGAPVSSKAVVLGGVLPDGTLALPHLGPATIERAAAAGASRIGFPAGMRHSREPGSGKRVDLVELAASHHVTAVEVTDVAAAYRFLTGRTLPQPRPLEEQRMELAGDIEGRVEAACDRWRARLAPEWARVLQRGEAGLSDPLRRLGERAGKLVAAAERDRTEGLFAPALHRFVGAYRLSRQLARAAAPGSGPGAEALAAEAAALGGDIDRALAKAVREAPASLGAALGAAARIRTLLAARRQVQLAAAATATPRRYFAREAAARTLFFRAEDAAAIEGSWGRPAHLEPRRAGALIAGYRAAAAAMAAAAGGDSEPAVALPAGGEAALLGKLAAARADEQRAWSRLARARLLALELHPVTRQVTSVGEPKALSRLLDRADRAALASARVAEVAAGEVPVAARLAYQAARSVRDGDAADKIEALELYWSVGARCELAALLSR